MDHKHCIVCGTVFYKPYVTSKKKWLERKYCTHKCYWLKKKGTKRIKDNCACLICGRSFHTKPSHVRNGEGKYCSKKCKHEGTSKFQSGENHYNWKNGISRLPYPMGWTKCLKESIRARDGYKCRICGCPQIENIKKLDIHHVDYDKNNLDPENLVSLCMSCHRKTNHRRKYWIDYFERVLSWK